MASAGQDEKIRLWNMSGKEPRERATLPGYRYGPTLAFAPDGATLAWSESLLPEPRIQDRSAAFASADRS